MAKPEPQIDDLRERLSGLLADWETEISAVIRALEGQQVQAATHAAEVKALANQVTEIKKLRQQVRDRDVALDHLKRRSKDRDQRLAELERELQKARALIAELEQKVGAMDKAAPQQKDTPHAEVEAMRAELAARKSLVKTLRSDAERGKALEKEVTQNRQVIATMKESIERDAKTIAELRLSSNSWERKYRKLAEAGHDESARASGTFADSDIFLTDTAVGMFIDDSKEIDGGHTVVIDMTEPLREARDERSRKSVKR